MPSFLALLRNIVSSPSVPLGMDHDCLRDSDGMGGVSNCVAGGMDSHLRDLFGGSHGSFRRG